MGSVRRATWREYLPFLLLNVVVSAATILTILFIWEGRNAPPALQPTATLDALSRVSSAVPTFTATLPPSPTPVTYTVGAGDTLGAISVSLGISPEAIMEANGLQNPDELSVGQVLIVPNEETASVADTAATPPPAAPTLTPAPVVEPPAVEIRGVEETGDIESEAIRLLNTGGVANMVGWTIRDGEGNVYVFPAFTLHSGAVTVHTGSGNDTVIDLYWGLPEAVWTAGKIVTLSDSDGNVLSTFDIP